MSNEYTELIGKLGNILKELTFHAKESKCEHSVRDLLDSIDCIDKPLSKPVSE
jgi:hypothetical protein